MRNVLRAGTCAAAILAPTFAVSAADLAAAPPVAPAPLWSWTGVYAGFHLASGWADNRWSVGDISTADEHGSGTGVIGGGQLGLNYQTGSWVWGAEVAFGLADINAQTACASARPLPGRFLTSRFNCTTNIDSLGTAAGRLGYAFDQFLLYGKGGAAAEHVHYQLLPFPTSNFRADFNGAGTRWGWTAGAGVEFAFSPTLSSFAEYDFMDFGNNSTSVIDGNGNRRDIRTSQSVHLVKVGLNYKLGQDVLPWTKVLPAWPASPVAWNWSGVYVGGHVGGGWGTTNWNSATGILGSGNGVFAGSGPLNGFAVGGQIGANYQVASWVIGAEADASWSDLDGSAKCGISDRAVTAFTCRTRINALGTLTGRFGQSFGRLLVYGKAGAAWGVERHVAQAIAPVVDLLFADNNHWGWTLGVGLEYAFTPAWSGKVEYNYLNFADRQLAFNNGLGNSANAGLSQNLSIVKMGFNYKLGVDPTASSAAPGPMWVKAPMLKAPAPSDWTIEAGARYWVSSGRKQLDLAGLRDANFLLSRLVWENVAGQAAEGFARLDHRDGMFLKGNLGLGDLAKGQFYDEDFGPDTIPYQNTLSVQRDGRTIYGSLDVGHAIISGGSGDIGAYVGYRQFYDRENAFGFRNLASFPLRPFPFSLLSLSNTETWSGMAVGLNARAQLNDRWRLEVDAALLPFVGVWNIDNHWQRADFNPQPAVGDGWGSQFEAILSYALTDQWSIGAGGRYWYFATSRADSVALPIKLYSERYGGFVQTTYKFGGPTSTSSSAVAVYRAPPAPVTWTGFYTGASLGAGFGRAAWSDPFGPVSIGDQDRVSGALLGGQAGANYQIGAIVYGIEAAGSWAPLTGTASCFAGNPNQVIAGQDCGTRVGALAFLTGRAGYALDRTLYYAKAGPAWGHSTFDLNFAGAAPTQVASTNADRWGWTIGGGVEHALTREWSIVGEYKYVDLGSASVSFAGTPAALAPVAREAINQRYQVLTLGMNYKLN